MKSYTPDVYYLGFSLAPGIGPVRFQALLKRFGDVEKAFLADTAELTEIVGTEIAARFVSWRGSTQMDIVVERCSRLSITILTLNSPRYPALLAQIPDPPICLYVLGNRGDIDLNCPLPIAVIGSRKCTPYGTMVTQMITRDLVAAGATIVSGLALGIDAIAHQATLEAGGKAIAVLGSGVDIVYPPANGPLRGAILQKGGAVISEYPPGTMPNRGSFITRNRIISGISRGVLITEGTNQSGSLTTASFAAGQGRDVFAVPGPIDIANSQGPLTLLKQGAKLVTSAEDILTEYALPPRALAPDSMRDLSDDEKRVYDLLSQAPQHVDDIARTLSWNIMKITHILTVFEIEGTITKDLEGKYRVTFSHNR